MIVSDATTDARVGDNTCVLRPDAIRSHDGVSVRAGTGEAPGTIGVIDRKPRSFSAGQLRALRIIARQVDRPMDLRRPPPRWPGCPEE